MSVGQTRLQWFGWLRWFLEGWVRARHVPTSNIFETLEVDPKQPICYVLKSSSIFDFIVLDLYCARLGLPRPLAGIPDLGEGPDATSVYLSQVGFLRTYGAYRHQPPSPFYKFLKRAHQSPQFNVQLIPVTVFWGRDPGRGEPSLFKLFFPDDDRASFVQKLFIVLANGKDVAIHFSKAIPLREQMSEGSRDDQLVRKLTRVIRVHFQSLRNSIMGPGLISRSRVIETLVRSKNLRLAIQEECRKKNIPKTRAESLAREYISEIAAEVSPSTIAGAAVVLRKIWNRIYQGIRVEYIDRIRSVPANAEIVYVPCHRSHMDYLLLNSILYEHHILTPHVAAGINLNFWPVGSLIRRFGAFYIRRSFKNNRLYAAVFSEYVAFLLQKGFPVQFFLEGGRSRTGKLLQPKTGMVSMVVANFIRNYDRPLYFVPIYISYDRVAEVKTYRRELAGSKKKNESVGQLVQGRKVLRSSHGQAHLSFAEPINLETYLNQKRPQWKTEVPSDEQDKPAWFNHAVQDVAQSIMESINGVAICGDVALVSLILLATRQKALPEDELIAHVGCFIDIAEKQPYTADVKLPNKSPKDIVESAERVGRFSRFQYPGGDVLHAIEPQASLLTYYRNNIAHLFAVPSAIAFFLQHNDSVREDVILEGMKTIYPILKNEFFLPWSTEECVGLSKCYIKVFLELGLFVQTDQNEITRPEMTKFEFNILRTLGLIVGPTLERFAVASHLLKQYGNGVAFKLDDFEKRCVLMAQRISLLTGATEAELPSAPIFKSIIEQLKEQGMIQSSDGDQWVLTPAFNSVLSVTSVLISVDMRHSILRAKG